MSLFRNHIMRSMIQSSKNPAVVIPISLSMPGNVCLYDKVNDKNIIVSGYINSNDYPLSDYTPIGVVIVPGIHAVYGENTCGILSLVGMSCNTPTTGTIGTDDEMCFAPQADIGTLNNYNVVIVEDGAGGLKTNGFGYLSKNAEYVSTTLRIPDPYLPDMSRNPDYYNTSISKYNAMADFKGRANTTAVVKYRGTKDYNTWKPSATTSTDYSACSACDMFYTDGTQQGDWYLPGAGELGYMMSKWDIILEAFNMLNKVYGEICKPVENNSSYWTSSEHNRQNTRYVHTDNGMGHIAKTTSCKTRAVTIISE